MDCPLDYADNYYTINFQRFEKELADGVRAVVLCNPHNPVGRVWTEEEVGRIAGLCARYQVYLLSDEIHSDFGFTRPYTTAGRFTEIRDRLVVYTAISKTFNMAGLGSSCMIIPNPELKKKIADSCRRYLPKNMVWPLRTAATTEARQTDLCGSTSGVPAPC